METPKSIEVSRILAWDFLKRTAEHKGTPGERKLQLKIIDHVLALEGFQKDAEGRPSFKFPKDPPNESEIGEDKMHDAMTAFNKEFMEWMNEEVFVEASKKERAWIWKTFYVADFNGAMEPIKEQQIDDAAKALGKVGALTDMRDEVTEWEDTEDTEEE